MNKLITILFGALVCAIAWAGAFAQVGPPNVIQCNSISLTQPSVASSTIAIVTGVTGKIIAICGWHVTSTSTSATPATFQFSQGAGANCGTTPTAIIPTESLTSNAPSADHVDYASLSIPAGNNLCANISSTAVNIGVWFSQF